VSFSCLPYLLFDTCSRHGIIKLILLFVNSAWVEEASSPGCVNCVINDLDLEVSLKGRTHFPNGKNGKDKKNSAERVIINGVMNGEVATITVTGENLSRMQQKYSVVVTGCFGGVANQLYANGECSAFDCDDSQSRRTKKILMAIFIPIGFALVCVAASSLLRKRRRKTRAARRARV